MKFFNKSDLNEIRHKQTHSLLDKTNSVREYIELRKYHVASQHPSGKSMQYLQQSTPRQEHTSFQPKFGPKNAQKQIKPAAIGSISPINWSVNKI